MDTRLFFRFATFCLIGIFSIFNQKGYGQVKCLADTALYATYFGASGSDLATSVAHDKFGNTYIAGNTQSTSGIATKGAYQTNPRNIFLAKFNCSGGLIWATYYGGNNFDVCFGITSDDSGNIYLTGKTLSTSGIATTGAYQTSYGYGSDDVFLTKFDSSGTPLWGTYYGSVGIGHAVATDKAGNVYLTGQISWTTGLATSGAYQTYCPFHNGAGTYTFLAKFNRQGSRLWGTYYGAGDNDISNAVAVDSSGNVYIAGATGSDSDIATKGAYQTSNSGGGFLAKFDSSGSRLLWGTYYGDSAPVTCTGIAHDNSDNVYITGWSWNSNSIATHGAYQTSYGGGNYDAFLAKFSGGGAIQWATYYGGNGDDIAYGVSTDNKQSIYISGGTTSSSGIATNGAYQSSLKGKDDGFLAKFSNGGAMEYSTYFGNDINVLGINTDNNGNAYLAGEADTGGTSFATSGAFQTKYAGIFEAFFAKIPTPRIITSCLSGAYTIGGPVADFPTFTAAVKALDSFGVCGPVVFNVADGVYKERISIHDITGVSSVNTITFQSASGDSTKVRLEDSLTIKPLNTVFLVSIYNISNITFKEMTFRRLGKAYPNPSDLFIIGKSSYISILNSILTFDGIDTVGWSGWGVYSQGETVSFLTVKNNIIRNSEAGILLGEFGSNYTGVSNVDISENLFDSCGFGLDLIGVDKAIIDHNVIHGIVGIYGFFPPFVDSFSFSFTNNSIYALNNGGLNCLYVKSPKNSPSVIANNFISLKFDWPDTSDNGCAGSVYCKNINWYFNNLLVSGVKPRNTNVFGSASDTGVNVFNNNFVSPFNDAVFFYHDTLLHSDYNNIYSGDSIIGQYNLVKVKNIKDWQTVSGQDAHSISINPDYISSTDLHSTNDSLYGKGIAISGITNDIDGKTRPNPPTVGANELKALFIKHLTASFSVPDTNCVQTAVSFSDSSKSDSCGVINHWLWAFGDGNSDTTQNPAHTYTSAGIFTVKLAVSSSGGCSDSFSKTIFVDSTCVWPGDANNNKVVEITDVLNIGIAYNDSGAKRAYPNSLWAGQYCDNWGKTFATGGDYKHADCNGDGVIDSLDLMAITLNWGDFHLKTMANNTGSPADPPFYLLFSKTNYIPGDTVLAAIMLGNSTTPLTNVYGIASSFNFNPAYVDTKTLKISFSKSWFGTPGADMLGFTQPQYGVNTLFFAATRIDHKNTSGNGNIGIISFVIPQNAASNNSVKFQPSAAKLIAFDESVIPLYLLNDTYSVDITTGIQKTNNANTTLRISPNPFTTSLSISYTLPQNEDVQITLTDMTGKEVAKIAGKNQSSGHYSYTLDAEKYNIPAGIYFLRMAAGNEAVMEKVVRVN